MCKGHSAWEGVANVELGDKWRDMPFQMSLVDSEQVLRIVLN